MSSIDLSLKAQKSGDTIVLHYNGEQITLHRKVAPEIFKQVEGWINAKDSRSIMDNFTDIKSIVEKYSKGNFTIDNKQQLVDKKTHELIPELVGKKLREFKQSAKDFDPLWRFWCKLRQNPSEASKQDLYGFMLHNKIPITELGDILVEKGVRQKADGTLVDDYTGTMDNSIGMIVEMPRDKVNADRNQTCSHGLHVAAPSYVRRAYSHGVIIRCTVDPKDVVSVPVDYNNTKMRVCRYQVIGLSDKSQKPNEELTIKLDKVVELPKLTVAMPKLVTSKPKEIDNKAKVAITSGTEGTVEIIDLVKLSATKIMDYVKGKLGINLNMNPKNKSSIVKKAQVLLTEQAAKDKIGCQDATFEIPLEAIEEAKKLLSSGTKLLAVKAIKDATSLGLKEAKEYVDNLEVELKAAAPAEPEVPETNAASETAPEVSVYPNPITAETVIETVTTIDFTGKTVKEILTTLGPILGSDETNNIAGKDPRKARVIKKATPLLEAKGYKVNG